MYVEGLGLEFFSQHFGINNNINVIYNKIDNNRSIIIIQIVIIKI